MRRKVIFLVFLSVVFFTLETALAEEAADVASADWFGGDLGDSYFDEDFSSDLWVSADEYPREGGDALDDLIKSLVMMRTFDSASYELEGNYEIVKEISGKLKEGGGVDKIRLIALRQEDGAYDRSLLLEIRP